MNFTLEDKKICVVGLGYVGLPLAVELGKKFDVIGFDINPARIKELQNSHDRTREVTDEELKSATRVSYSSEKSCIREAQIFIITVPTPIDAYKKPDLRPLLSATQLVGEVLSKGDLVIYESTVYPGCTEDECVPVLESVSGLQYNKDFYCGYSPERINPGDQEHRISSIKKVTSGSTPEIGKMVDQMYKTIITAGTHLASSIKVAEAAKVIENAQRDLNIAFVNELALIFDRVGIDTREVLDAAGTKWNFLPFKPGLVGGHCIGVDPYYLTHKAESLGYHPEVILAGRRINDNMGFYIAHKIVKLLSQNGHTIKGANVLVMGITFKENCPDIRNTRVIDIIHELKDFGINVEIWDPLADTDEVKEEYGLDLIESPDKRYDGVVMAVNHAVFDKFNWDQFKNHNTVIYDVKGGLDKEWVTGKL